MNFQQVTAANGQKVTMFGVFTEIGGTQFTPQQKAKAICKVTDDSGASHNVHIYQGTGQLPTLQNLNQRSQFSLSTFQGRYQNKPYTGFSGFWNSTAQVNQQQTAPQNAQQGSSQPAERPNDTQTQILRQCAGKIAAALVAGNIETFENRFKEAERWVQYFKKGLTPNLLPGGERFGDGAKAAEPQDVRGMKEENVPWENS